MIYFLKFCFITYSRYAELKPNHTLEPHSIILKPNNQVGRPKLFSKENFADCYRLLLSQCCISDRLSLLNISPRQPRSTVGHIIGLIFRLSLMLNGKPEFFRSFGPKFIILVSIGNPKCNSQNKSKNQFYLLINKQ